MVNKLRGLYESEKSHKSYPQAFKDEAVLIVLARLSATRLQGDYTAKTLRCSG
ncbi:Uncharacterised protein [Shewanella putrefaciens]|nr:hypothetical protein [Shewanella putrefaciens]SUI77012.1 Uncharacterised protein [Shewanella putrefaciens]